MTFVEILLLELVHNLYRENFDFFILIEIITINRGTGREKIPQIIPYYYLNIHFCELIYRTSVGFQTLFIKLQMQDFVHSIWNHVFKRIIERAHIFIYVFAI